MLNPLASIAELQDWRDRLFKSRLTGVRRVTDQNGETVVYRTDAEIAAALAAVDRAIAAAQQTPPRTIVFQTSKGL